MYSKRWAIWGTACALLVAANAFAGNDPDPITLGIGDGTTNVGDTVEILVDIDSGDTQPSTMVIFIAYDPAKIAPVGNAFEFTFTDDNGDPVLDSDGNAITFRSIVRPEAALTGRNKAIDTEVLDEGVLGIAIQGGTARIPDGPLLTATFRVLDAASPNDQLALDGVNESAPIPVTNEQGEVSVVFSSAAASIDNGQGGQQTVSIPVTHADGIVTVGCQPVAATPQNVTASEGRPDAVVISWDAVATVGAEYRVFRSSDQDLDNAVPLGSGWSPSTFFTDITAQAPAMTGTGCSCNANPEVIRYFYWVRARTPQGCEGDFSDPPVSGYRGAAKAASANATTKARVYPQGTVAGGEIPLALGAAAAMRVDGKRPDDAALWSSASATLEIFPASSGAWWIVATPAPAWNDDEVIVLTAGAQVRSFIADAALANPAQAKALAVDFAGDAAPWLPEGVGVAYTTGTEGVFAAPQTLWLPVPQGEDAASLRVYAYHESEGDRAWYYARQVDGLVVGVPQVRETAQGAEIGVTLRHSAILQLGHPISVQAPAAASVVPPSFGQLLRSHAGSYVVFGLMVIVLAGARGFRSRGTT